MIRNRQFPNQPTRFRPPLVSLLYGGAWSFVTHQLYVWGQEGWELGNVASLAAAAMAIGQLVKATHDQFLVQTHKEKHNEFDKQKEQQGASRWANAADIAKCKFLSPDRGVFLGSFVMPQGKTVDVYYDGEGSISIIAPPGEGKTTSLVIPSLLANPQDNLIINDPKGEIFTICTATKALQNKGYKILVLTPFADELTIRLGLPVVDAGLDIFSEFNGRYEPASIRRRLMKIMRWLCPDKPNMQDRDKFFYKSARMLGMFFALNDLIQGYKPSLTSMREQLMEGMHGLANSFAEAEESTELGGLFAELAKSLRGILEKAGPQFAGGFGVLDQHLDPYDHYSELGQHTSGAGIDPRVLKDPEQKTAVFLISGLENIEIMTPTTALTLNYLFDSIAADTQHGRCTAIIDECGSLSGLSSLPAKLERYRGANLRAVMIWQDASQAERNYGKVAFKQILAASKVKVGMGLQEPESLSMFSKLCGTQSVVEMSLNDGAGPADPMPYVTHSSRHAGIPLYREDAIRTMSDEEMLIIGGNLQPLRLRKAPYFLRPEWDEIAAPSPFRREVKHV